MLPNAGYRFALKNVAALSKFKPTGLLSPATPSLSMSAMSNETMPALELYQRLNSRPADQTPGPSRESSQSSSHEPPPPSLRLGYIPTTSYLTANAYATPHVEKGDLTSGQRYRVGRIARRVHGWSWQAFPVGMGTGAVYVHSSSSSKYAHSRLYQLRRAERA